MLFLRLLVINVSAAIDIIGLWFSVRQIGSTDSLKLRQFNLLIERFKVYLLIITWECIPSLSNHVGLPSYTDYYTKIFMI